MNTNTVRSDRPSEHQPYGYSFDQVTLELASERITVDGQNVASPPLPFRLLQAICERPGTMVSRKDLFEFIWPRQVATNEALSKVISRLRDLLGPYGARVVTVRSRGVRLDATVRRLDEPSQMVLDGSAELIEPVSAEPQGIVLIVDDSPETITVLTEVLKDCYKTKIATNGASAIKAAARTPQPDVILMDVTMPGMDGYELCQALKNLPNTADIPVIFLTGKVGTQDEAKGFEVGAVDYINKPISPPVVLARTATHLRLARIQRKLKRQNEDLEHLVQVRTNELTQVQDATIVAMAALAETRDDETGNHIRRTQHYMALLAEALQHHPRFRHELNRASIDLLFKSAPLHDIGKVGVPDHILKKQGRLTAEEFEIIKMHTTWGGNTIRSVEELLGESSDYLRFAREIAYSHQERWDGTGYPEGLAGDEIPVSARLMAVADVYDALISRRRYKPAFTHEKAVSMMESERAKHFDPDVLDAFLEIEQKFRNIAEQFADPQSASNGDDTPPA